MKCTIAKHNPLLLQQAIKHYQKSREIFTFMSLYNDFEPFPIEDIIEVLKRRIDVIKGEIDDFTKSTSGLRRNEALETMLYTAEKQLKAMEKRQVEINAKGK